MFSPNFTLRCSVVLWVPLLGLRIKPSTSWSHPSTNKQQLHLLSAWSQTAQLPSALLSYTLSFNPLPMRPADLQSTLWICSIFRVSHFYSRPGCCAPSESIWQLLGTMVYFNGLLPFLLLPSNCSLKQQWFLRGSRRQLLSQETPVKTLCMRISLCNY